MAENVRVIVRCRPMNQRENNTKCKNIIEIKDCAVHLENPTDLTAPVKTFTYDNAYGLNAPTEAIYNDICYSLIENVLEGYNGTIFAYGQTGCGKSHTMQGPTSSLETSPILNNTSSSQRGIISRSFDHIFEAISVSSGVRYLALVSYLEIYNETIRDLLHPADDNNANLQLKEIPGEGVIVQNLTTHAVHNAKECEELLRIGTQNRMVGATLMNAGSSRSHSLFTINIEQIEIAKQSDNKNELETKSSDLLSSTQTSSQSHTGIRKGKLNLVDLAGSERQNKTGATGDRLKEATKINLSLSALGNVISALVDSKTKHIPYRDSKLTRLLQDSLGGNTKTLMIACISPADYNYDETLSTLRYASRAKNIHNKPKINEDPKDTMLKEYQKEITELRKLLATQSNSKSFSLNDDMNEFNREWLENEKVKLKSEYEAETMRLKSEHEAQQKEKEELVKDMERLKTHYERQLKNLSAKPNLNKIDTIQNSSPLHDLVETRKQEQKFYDKKLLMKDQDFLSFQRNKVKIPVLQQEALNRIEIIKNALIGGERANDVQLKEKRYKKKLAAQRRLSALAHALNRVEQSSDRDLLQEHYTDIQQELKAKTESIKSYRQKIRALEREISDLQSEFQLDRADYLETIRKLEKNLKFYQQLLETALPILRKDGKYWDPDTIQQDSVWNDDLKKWKLPEDSMNKFKLPPATSSGSVITGNPVRLISNDNLIANNSSEGDINREKMSPAEKDDIADTYFLRPKRTSELLHQRLGFNVWRDFTKRQIQQQQNNSVINGGNRLNSNHSSLNSTHSNNNNGGWTNSASSTIAGIPARNSNSNKNSLLASWLSQNHYNNFYNNISGIKSSSNLTTSNNNIGNNHFNNINNNHLTSLTRTWCGLSAQNLSSLVQSPQSEISSGSLNDVE